MTKLSKIAILLSKDSNLTFEMEDIQSAFNKSGIEVTFFDESDSIIEYKPDCVIVTTPQDGKLTPFPTYGLMNWSKEEYLTIPRFVRNILTYDGYFTTSPELKQTINDLMFGARKLGTSILDFNFYPVATEFKAPDLDAKAQKIVIFEPDLRNSKFKHTIDYLLAKMANVSVVTFAIPDMAKQEPRIIVAKDDQDFQKIIREHHVAVYLNADNKRSMSLSLIKLISMSIPVIAGHTENIEKTFGDSLHYISNDVTYTALPELFNLHLKKILENKTAAIANCLHAHQIFVEKFSMEGALPRFIEFHQKTLIDKGYAPKPDPDFEKALPSVSFIMRTGGKHRHFLERTLDCMVAQQYPDLRIIFVVHALFPYINELIQNYPSLQIKVVVSLKSRRSEAICDGMAAVETDLFGLYDDDDEMFPNHVRSMVYALQYHANRDWRGEISMVYSGSLHVDDTYTVPERAEFQDHKLTSKNEMRAIEHFRFYSSVGMSQHTWFMPNGWLARSKFIDNELLVDPELDTCEDLYFELQFAQRGHFAFSAEITTVHHFHHFGNSTLVDSYKHFPDTQRIALRNFTRVFPQDITYDIAEAFRLVGFPAPQEKGVAYQDSVPPVRYVDYTCNQFYPFRKRDNPQVYVPHHVNTPQHKILSLRTVKVLAKVFIYGMKFIALDSYKKKIYFEKAKKNIREIGYYGTLKKVARYVATGQISVIPPKKNMADKHGTGIISRFLFGWLRLIKLAVKRN